MLPLEKKYFFQKTLNRTVKKLFFLHEKNVTFLRIKMRKFDKVTKKCTYKSKRSTYWNDNLVNN